MKYSIGIILLILIGCVNKTSSEDFPKVILDPNPTSEMAQQMREMTKELEAIKIKLEKKRNSRGKPSKFRTNSPPPSNR